MMREFLRNVWDELVMSFVRLGYFLRHGELHPDLKPPEPGPVDPLIRLWDKEWNYLATVTDVPHAVTIELIGGTRHSFMVELTPHSEYLRYLTVPPNPFWELPDNPFDPSDWFGDEPVSKDAERLGAASVRQPSVDSSASGRGSQAPRSDPPGATHRATPVRPTEPSAVTLRELIDELTNLADEHGWDTRAVTDYSTLGDEPCPEYDERRGFVTL